MSTAVNGLLVLDKPGGMTSREAVDQAEQWFSRRTRLGHTGTLDPLASGVLVVCVGAATRLTEYVQRMGKTYRSVFRLGASSDTDDAEGVITPVPGAVDPGVSAVTAALQEFVGSLEQVPPRHSAAKVDGRRAYKMARRGEEVDLDPRTVQVYGIDVLRYAYPELEVEVRCGKGTYIRSLARDLGERLGCGGYVEVLRRTRVGPFTPEQAIPLDASRNAVGRLLPMALALSELPRFEVSDEERDRLVCGQAIPAPVGITECREVAVFDGRGRFVAVGSGVPHRGLLKPAKVFTADPEPSGPGSGVTHPVS